MYGVANDHEVFTDCDDSDFSGCDMRIPFIPLSYSRLVYGVMDSWAIDTMSDQVTWCKCPCVFQPVPWLD